MLRPAVMVAPSMLASLAQMLPMVTVAMLAFGAAIVPLTWALVAGKFTV